jgi:hypothetical protein
MYASPAVHHFHQEAVNTMQHEGLPPPRPRARTFGGQAAVPGGVSGHGRVQGSDYLKHHWRCPSPGPGNGG